MSTQRASVWSLTINNPVAGDWEAINLARQKGWQVEGQIEKGQEGTEHLQLCCRTPQVRFSAVKRQFPRAHIEIARNPAALAAYVTKEETRVGQLPTGQDRYPSLSKFWDLIFTRMDEWNWIDWSEGVPTAWFKDAPNGEPLAKLDAVAGSLIEDGYYVEGIASNPATRSAWKLWHWKIIARSYKTKSNPQIEHNHADVPSQSQASDGLLEREHRPQGQALGDSSGEESGSSGPEGSGDDCNSGV